MTPNEYADAIDRLARELELLKQQAFPEHAKKLVAKKLCLSCGKPIGSDKPVRHCHKSCYRTIKRDIENGSSEGRAIAFGLLGPEQKSGRKIKATGARAKMLKTTDPAFAEPDKSTNKRKNSG